MSEVVRGWAIWHPTKGFNAYVYEGAIAWADIGDDLIEDVNDLNETDGTDKTNGWRIIAVHITPAPLSDTQPEGS